MTTLKIWKVHPDVRIPQHQTTQSACFDLAYSNAGKGSYKGYTAMNKPFTRILSGSLSIGPGDRVLVPTGMIMDIPEGYSVRIHARSGTSLKQGLVLVNAEGVIDSDYVEEVFVLIHNISSNSITINPGDRIAQAELVQTLDYIIEQAVTRPLPKTNRAGGFGSTGVITDVVTSSNMVVINIDKPQLPKFITEEVTPENVKRGRGRPRKNPLPDPVLKRGRGRPRKNP
jgi:dUTP pyrophosphatase